MELWATLPSLNRLSVVGDIFECTDVTAVRLNTGVYSPLSPRESLRAILDMSSTYASGNKRIWVDLDGRQLRVKNWSYPRHGGKICLNRSVTFGDDAEINFRGDRNWYKLTDHRGKSVFIDQLPKEALGAGQTVNISASDLKVAGPYLTGLDKQYIVEALRLGINRFMLSFFEQQSDIDEVVEAACGKEIELILKIENDNGFRTVNSIPLADNVRLMAARDDWYINSCGKASFLRDLERVVKIDDKAIVASRIFSDLDVRGEPSLSDWEDLELMKNMGYKTFMLSDGVCQYSFEKTISAWKEYYCSIEEV